MTTGTGVFVLTGASVLTPMQTASFASEDDFQDLLARFPALLAGDQINAADPRRFVLVDREQPIASEPNGPDRWSLDHLFLDQDGVPTLVEVKRGTDTRIRREVIGQMLDYAANAASSWPLEKIRERFETRCGAQGDNVAAVLTELLGAMEPDTEGFWAKVKSNLLAGRIRMLFVADHIPPELRKVVEFLNLQMRPAEVLAIELRQYAGQGLRALVPIVLGQTQEALEQKSGGSAAKPRRQWDEAQILTAIAARGDAALTVGIKALLAWMNQRADRMVVNDTPNVGSIGAEFHLGGVSCLALRLWTDGSAAINFGQLMATPAFSALARRQALMSKLNALPGVTLRTDAIERSAYFRPGALAVDQGAGFIAVLNGMVETLREPPIVSAA